MREEIIHYGIGKDYLKSWGLKEALREIFQNYIDYSKDGYETIKHFIDDELSIVSVSNSYEPESLEFLRIGYSNKGDNKNPIGKHGEGLKMALLIFAREGLPITVYTKGKAYNPVFIENGGLGECFAIKVTEGMVKDGFTIGFNCPTDILNEFLDGIINSSDILFNDPEYGSVLNKPKGAIYSGGLKVYDIANFSRSYDINPSLLHLDRDRHKPNDWEVKQVAANIMVSEDTWILDDGYKEDAYYINKLPDRLAKLIKLKKGDKCVKFHYIDKFGKESVIINGNLRNLIRNHPLLKDRITALQKQLRTIAHARCTTIIGALKVLIKTHYISHEVKLDLKDIIKRIRKGTLK